MTLLRTAPRAAPAPTAHMPTDYAPIDMGLNRGTIRAVLDNPRSRAAPRRLGCEPIAVFREAVP